MGTGRHPSTGWTGCGSLDTIVTSRSTRCFLADITRPLEPPLGRSGSSSELGTHSANDPNFPGCPFWSLGFPITHRGGHSER